ncbi:MAG: hypothetical protein IPJ71_18325 [Bdellovibrionales bacterium]|nr:hypothetical protein [Bdellovibrionales bacterium]
MRFLIMILILMAGGVVTSNEANASSMKLEEILTTIGDSYISRVEATVLPNAVNDSNLGFLNEVTTFTNLLVPRPQSLNPAFPGKTGPQLEEIREQLKRSLQNKLLGSLLNKVLLEIDDAVKSANSSAFREAANLYFGIVLLWNVRADYFLNSVEADFSEDKLLSLIEQIGRLEPYMVVGGRQMPGPVFSASYLFRYHIKNDVSDLYYFWTAIVPRLEAQYGSEYKDLPQYLTRKLFDFLVFGIEQGSGKMDGLAQNFLSDFAKIYNSVEQHFPFHENVGPKNYGKLGILRENYKTFGNTFMVDRINRLRLSSLATYPTLTPSWIERTMLKTWGLLTDWGTSARRVVFIGMVIFCALFFASLGSSVEDMERNSQVHSSATLEKIVRAAAGTTNRFVSYATMQHSTRFESTILDHGFAVTLFCYYSILLGTVVSFIVRHN